MPNHRLHQIESNHLWPDFHAKFLNYWQESLMDALPADYDARIGEQVCLFSAGDKSRRLGPDISIVQSQSAVYGEDSTPHVLTTTLDHVDLDDELRWRHIEIIHRPDRRIVAVLELLSPSNKCEPGFSRYLIKRNEFLFQPVHLIEVDLLLGGHRLPHLQALPQAEYYAFVTRSESPARCQVTAWSGECELPSISIPLLPPDRDICCSLQNVFEITFEKGRY